MQKTTRFSGADWASELKDIIVVGQGGIGSWLTLNLSRIGHPLYTVDDDRVDETNVTGGQMFRSDQIGIPKVDAVKQVCRAFGCTNVIDNVAVKFSYEKIGATNIMITGLDNMKARRETFDAWKEYISDKAEGERAQSLFIDGRLSMEMWEIFAMRGNDEDSIEAFERDHLFTDEESIVLDCSTKQSTFAAMSIAASITSTLCNFLTNCKLSEEVRTVPFYQRMYFPINLYEVTFPMDRKKNDNTIKKTEITSNKTEITIVNGNQ